MKKHIILIILLVVRVQFCNSNVPPLTGLVSRTFFTFKNGQEEQAFNQRLIEGKINLSTLKFEGVTLKDMDLSGMYLRGIDFSGCTFINVNLQNADLTDTRWDRASLDDLRLLKGAILYYPLDPNNQPIMDQAFRIETSDDHGLVQQYSMLMSQARKKNFDASNPEVRVLLDKAEGLNKIIGSVKIYLRNKNLQNFDLTDIRWGSILLWDISLQGAWLSDTVQVPHYPEDNRTELFKLWAAGDEQYQKLWNDSFNLITGVEPNLVRTTLEKKVELGVDLRNGYLSFANLQEAYLKHAQLQNAHLSFAHLQGAHLEHAQLQNAYLWNAHLQGAHLEHAQLQNAKLNEARLQKAHLENAQLQNAILYDANLQGAYLEHAQLQNTDLYGANLKGIHLKGANLGGVRLASNFILPMECKDEDLMRIYHECTDQDAKKQLKDILIGKEIIAAE